MAYTKASDRLPRHLLEAVQDYVDGEYLYIPRKQGQRKAWGELTNSRQRLAARNAAIVEHYQAGLTVSELAARYYLSAKAIYKVLAASKPA